MRAAPPSVLLAFLVAGFVVACPTLASAQTTLTFDADVPAGAETHFFVPFDVPAGTVEIEVRHDDGSANNILDWGLEDPNGFRGWGGGNTEPAVVGLDHASRSYVPGPMPTGTWRVVVGKAKIVDAPGHYHIEVDLRTTALNGPQTERAPYADAGALRNEARWYAGDLHVHSRESGDASPTIDAIAVLAENRGLDFVEISDHNTTTIQDFYVAAQARHPALLFVPGNEFTTYAGHANGIGATKWVNHRIGVEGATIEQAIAAFHAMGALFSPNHPGEDLGDACIGCGWSYTVDPASLDGVEIMTTGHVSLQPILLEPALALWDAACASGHHVAALGGSDDHRAGTGTGSFDSPIGDPTTMVYARELSVAGLLEGIKNGRTAVKLTGPSAPMAVLGATDALSGDTVAASHTTLTADVTAGSGTTLFVVKNGLDGDPVMVDADPFHYELAVSAPPTGEDRYRLEVRNLNGRLTITSHVYVKAATTPGDGGTGGGGGGCGCRLAGPAELGSLGVLVFVAFVTLLAARRARR